MDLLRDSPGLWVCFSFLCFAATNYIFGKLVPVQSREQGRVTTWKWTNIANSLLHSVVTGAGALYGWVFIQYFRSRRQYGIFVLFSDFTLNLKWQLMLCRNTILFRMFYYLCLLVGYDQDNTWILCALTLCGIFRLFFYDVMDMLLNHRKRSSYELMVHHTFVRMH